MRIFFAGAARGVTGSRHVLEFNRTRLLLDCGMYQGRRKESSELDFVKGCRPAPRQPFLVHGEEEQMVPLGKRLTEMGIPDVNMPMLGEFARL